MSKLKFENLNQCLFILKDFVEEAGSTSNKKGIARLALEQLQKVTAGNTALETETLLEIPLEGGADCVYRPRADN